MQPASGTAYRLEADGFTTNGRGTGGTGDTALLTDAAGVLYSTPPNTNATLSGTGSTITANSFALVQAIAVGPSDTATLQGGAGTNVFAGSKGTSEFKGVNFDNIAKGFFTVDAYGDASGYNTAVLTDASGNATATLSPQTATLTDASARGPAWYQINLASAFQVIQAFETSLAANSTAILKGSSTAANSFTSTSNSATLVPSAGNAYREYAQGFATVQATSTYATDTAYLFDSPGNNTFTGTPTSATMSLATGKTVVAAGFKTVNAYAEYGGTDTANLTGTRRRRRRMALVHQCPDEDEQRRYGAGLVLRQVQPRRRRSSGDTVTTMDASVLPTQQTSVAAPRSSPGWPISPR